MFQAKPQEYHDRYTGVMLAFGEHANGGSWVRITTRARGPQGEGPPLVSTIQLRHGEIIRSEAHPLAGPDAGGDRPDDPDAKPLIDKASARALTEPEPDDGAVVHEDGSVTRPEEAEDADKAEAKPQKEYKEFQKKHPHKKA